MFLMFKNKDWITITFEISGWSWYAACLKFKVYLKDDDIDRSLNDISIQIDGSLLP